jgi:hypothetical protein
MKKTVGFEIKAFKPELDIEAIEMKKDLQAMDIVVGICIALILVMVKFM